MTHRRYDLIALDLDGTTLRPDASLSEAVVDAVGRALARGVRVMLATARPPRAAMIYHRELGLDTPMVTYNGSMLVEADGTVIEHTPLPEGLGRRIAEAARALDPDVVVHVEAGDRWLTDRHDPLLTVASATAFPPDHVGPLDTFIDGPITKLMLLTPDERLPGLHAAITDAFGDEAGVLICDGHMMQCVDPSVDKSIAVARLAETMGVDSARVMAIGDAPNDTGMLRWAGLGVAVGNAWPEAKHVADAVVASNVDDGVAEAIDRFIVASA
ncbi:MAG: Cof-type HAD-IIB family hydrolase [Planctomycetota bacterium]